MHVRQQALGVSPVALKRAAQRLKVKRRLATPRRGFYTVVPLEYRQSGAPPAKAAVKLAKWVERRSPKFVHLRLDKTGKEISGDGGWRVIVNGLVEPDELPTPEVG